MNRVCKQVAHIAERSGPCSWIPTPMKRPVVPEKLSTKKDPALMKAVMEEKHGA